jgi:hypothetical protein
MQEKRRGADARDRSVSERKEEKKKKREKKKELGPNQPRRPSSRRS